MLILSASSNSSLSGWGPYKFGMTADQVRDVGYLKWRPVPNFFGSSMPDLSSVLVAGGVDAFDLHHVMAIANFDKTRFFINDTPEL